MAKPKKTDPIPHASDKIAFSDYDLYRSSKWGEYRVYPDGRIFYGDMESIRQMRDMRHAAKQLFDYAAAHVQEIEERCQKQSRQWWEARKADFGENLEGWILNYETGEMKKSEAAKMPEDETI